LSLTASGANSAIGWNDDKRVDRLGVAEQGFLVISHEAASEPRSGRWHDDGNGTSYQVPGLEQLPAPSRCTKVCHELPRGFLD
jgi:hypothetical protein